MSREASLSLFGGTAMTDESACCFHCGDRLPAEGRWQIAFDGRMRPLCCAGCDAVMRTIVDGGLGEYYRHRQGYAARPPCLDQAAPAASVRTASTAPPAKTDASSRLFLANLNCAACAWLAETTLCRVAGVQDAEVNFALERAHVRHDAAVTPEVLIDALRCVGLDAVEARDDAPSAAHRRARRRQLVELGVAWLCMMQVMMLTVPLYLAGPDEVGADARRLMGWAAWLLTLPILLVPGRRIFASAWRGLLAGQAGMDVPIAVALAVTFGAGTHALVSDRGQTYFDAVAMFVALVATARFIESGLRADARARIERLAQPAAIFARKVLDFPQRTQIVDVDAGQLIAGDIVEVAEGAPVPADGTLLDGAADFDEALMTGESLPVPRRAGEAVIGGAVNRTSPVLLRVDAPARQSTLARLAQLVERGLTARTLLPDAASRVSRWIAPLTLLLAAIAYFGWQWIDPAQSLAVAVSVLAVTCPCAFALAAPTAAASAFNEMAKTGLLATRGHVLDAFAHVSDIVLDKTGTLTAGELRVAAVYTSAATGAPSPHETLQLAAALEAGSAHPIARALRAAASPTSAAADIRHTPGAGVDGTVGGRHLRLGRIGFGVDADAPLPVNGATRIELSEHADGAWRSLGAFDLVDDLRDGAAWSVAQWRERGMRVHLLSGDEPAAVQASAQRAGIDAGFVHSRCSAEMKHAYVAALRERGGCVVAVGDGINDAPMLSVADAGVGLATGASLTSLSADAVADNHKRALFSSLSRSLELARRADRITRQNLWWAAFYNAVAVPLAMAGLVSPILAAAGMAASSLVVVINAARLATWNRSGF